MKLILSIVFVIVWGGVLYLVYKYFTGLCRDINAEGEEKIKALNEIRDGLFTKANLDVEFEITKRLHNEAMEFYAKNNPTNMKTIIQHTYIGYIGEHALDYATDEEKRKVKKEIAELKKNGTYGQPVDLAWSFKSLPSFYEEQDYSDYFVNMGFIIPQNH